MATTRTDELLEVAERITGALPPVAEEVVVTGSVSRGAADEVSDIEMLVVTGEQLELDQCFSLAAGAGLTELGTWGQQGVPTKRVSGYREGVPIELVWWSRAHAESAVDAIFDSDTSTTADALANGVALRTSGLLAGWQERLRHYPDELAAARIEDAALTWGGFAAAGLLTLIRPGERLALLERMVDDATRVTRIVFALNRVWQPTTKRLADRVAALEHKPERLPERIEEALTEPDARRALIVMTELQADTVAIAPDGPNVSRARAWLRDGLEILRRGAPLVVVVLAVLLLAGCGDNRSADEKTMEHKFEQIDFRMSGLETVTSQYNLTHFEQATTQYIALVRKYADALGPAEAKRRLQQKADELSSFCLPCTGALTNEARKY